MGEPSQYGGLDYDRIVFDYLNKNESGNMAEMSRETGLNDHQIKRAISEMRSKGYLIVPESSRRTWENDFKIVISKEGYSNFRKNLVSDIEILTELLATLDNAAANKFGDVPQAGQGKLL